MMQMVMELSGRVEFLKTEDFLLGLDFRRIQREREGERAIVTLQTFFYQEISLFPIYASTRNVSRKI